ncbi:unnamed protein product [Diabrotica balteata]|uniref:Uncharacterized protein n=1 Tax=Diabrotica balteata TaxID=107213 RepID=A0A9N9X690_DIABA|nr:unnamed protein product [Diabrotica balteata]
MKNIVLATIVLFAVYQSVDGIVCNHIYCSIFKCEESVVCNEFEILVEKASFCGCCDACYEKLYQGQSCKRGILTVVFPSTQKCVNGLECSSEGKCDKPELGQALLL